MAIGMVGVKAGMSRVFDSEGVSIPITVVSAGPNRVTQVKTLENDSYVAIQITHGQANEKRVSKALAGHFNNGKVKPGVGLWEFRPSRAAPESEFANLSAGSVLSVQQFFEGQIVDVVGVSKGKGFAGTIKRWNFRGQDNSHGNSLSHRVGGAIGQCQTPGKVFKGKKMSGHMGSERVTVQNLVVIGVDADRNLLLIKGGIPGANGSKVVVRPAVKVGPQVAPEAANPQDEANK